MWLIDVFVIAFGQQYVEETRHYTLSNKTLVLEITILFLQAWCSLFSLVVKRVYLQLPLTWGEAMKITAALTLNQHFKIHLCPRCEHLHRHNWMPSETVLSERSGVRRSQDQQTSLVNHKDVVKTQAHEEMNSEQEAQNHSLSVSLLNFNDNHLKPRSAEWSYPCTYILVLKSQRTILEYT